MNSNQGVVTGTGKKWSRILMDLNTLEKRSEYVAMVRGVTISLTCFSYNHFPSKLVCLGLIGKKGGGMFPQVYVLGSPSVLQWELGLKLENFYFTESKRKKQNRRGSFILVISIQGFVSKNKHHFSIYVFMYLLQSKYISLNHNSGNSFHKIFNPTMVPHINV